MIFKRGQRVRATELNRALQHAGAPPAAVGPGLNGGQVAGQQSLYGRQTWPIPPRSTATGNVTIYTGNTKADLPTVSEPAFGYATTEQVYYVRIGSNWVPMSHYLAWSG